MRAVLVPERVYVASFAETVHHLHFHVIPRYAEMPGLGPNLLPAVFGGEWSCSMEEAWAAAEAIRTNLSAR